MSASISFDHHAEDRRAAARARIQLSTQVRLFDRCLSANILDLSRDGMAVRAPEMLQADHILDIEFSLPYTEQSIACEAKVIWSDGRGHAGLQFRNINESARAAIGEWLTQYLAVPH